MTDTMNETTAEAAWTGVVGRVGGDLVGRTGRTLRLAASVANASWLHEKLRGRKHCLGHIDRTFRGLDLQR